MKQKSRNEMQVKNKIQSFGRFLSAMVMPNIGAFIAWGLITALFIPTGWLPNEKLAEMVGPMITYLLPLLIAYMGGRTISQGHRGGVLGAIATMGVIVGSDIPMFIGAMIMGPLGGWVIKKFDTWVEPRIPAGFEMLVNNFSAGIIGAFLAILAFYAISPIVQAFSSVVSGGVYFLVNKGLLPLVSIFIEPGKILFLNNAINHGILTPLGTEQVTEVGKSIYFLLEANPGPGLGVLLGYWVFARGSIKTSAPSAIIIHFLGGIHEIYFPYVLMRPILLLAVIAGGMSGIATLVALGGGLVSASSPGSIFAILALTPRDAFLANIAAVVVSTAVSFIVSAFILKSFGTQDQENALDEAKVNVKSLQNATRAEHISLEQELSSHNAHSIRKIVFACDAGMGSSAMGASSFRRKVQAVNLPIEVINTAIENIPQDADMVVTQQTLTSRAKVKSPQAIHISIDNFIGNPIYDEILSILQDSRLNEGDVSSERVVISNLEHAEMNTILQRKNIRLNLASESKIQAIRRAGEALVASGYVEADYIAAMLKREEVVSTYIGNGVAIPHGTDSAKNNIISSGIVVHQYPQGIDFDGEIAFLVVGIAGKNGEHMKILSQIALALEDEEEAKRLAITNDIEQIYNRFIG